MAERLKLSNAQRRWIDVANEHARTADDLLDESRRRQLTDAELFNFSDARDVSCRIIRAALAIPQTTSMDFDGHWAYVTVHTDWQVGR